MTACIWDLDGTLLNSYPVIVDSLIRAFAEQGIALEGEAVFRYVIRYSGQALIEKLASEHEVCLERLYRRNAELNRLGAPRVGLMPHAAEALRRLDAQGVAQFVYTHKGDSTETILQNLGIRRYFTEVVTGLAGFPRKPAPDALRYLIEKYRLTDVSYIGDRALDVACAKNAGVRSVLYLAHTVPVEKTADITIHDLLEIGEEGWTGRN